MTYLAVTRVTWICIRLVAEFYAPIVLYGTEYRNIGQNKKSIKYIITIKNGRKFGVMIVEFCIFNTLAALKLNPHDAYYYY